MTDSEINALVESIGDLSVSENIAQTEVPWESVESLIAIKEQLSQFGYCVIQGSVTRDDVTRSVRLMKRSNTTVSEFFIELGFDKD